MRLVAELRRPDDCIPSDLELDRLDRLEDVRDFPPRVLRADLRGPLEEQRKDAELDVRHDAVRHRVIDGPDAQARRLEPPETRFDERGGLLRQRRVGG